MRPATWPGRNSLRGYRAAWLRRDVLVGLTVAVIARPMPERKGGAGSHGLSQRAGPVSQDRHGRGVHACLDGAQGVAGLAGLSLCDLDGGGADDALGHGTVHDPGRRSVLAAVVGRAVSMGLVRGLRCRPGLDERGHAGGEGDVDVCLGQASVAAVGAHQAEVVGQGEHGAGCERMPLERGHGDQGQDWRRSVSPSRRRDGCTVASAENSSHGHSSDILYSP